MAWCISSILVLLRSSSIPFKSGLSNLCWTFRIFKLFQTPIDGKDSKSDGGKGIGIRILPQMPSPLEEDFGIFEVGFIFMNVISIFTNVFLEHGDNVYNLSKYFHNQ